MTQAPPNRLRELREQAGLTQQDVADEVNQRSDRHQVAASSGAVSRWELGRVAPGLTYRRLLAEVFGVTVDQLGITAPVAPVSAPASVEDYVDDDQDPRVSESQDQWRRTRRALNANRHALAQVAAGLYPDTRLGTTGLVTHPEWLPPAPVDLAAVDLVEHVDAPEPLLDGSERETALVRPQQSLVRSYARYTQAIRDLAPPRLFENRMSWRLLDLSWAEGKGRMEFGDGTYFGSVDVFEPLAHELAYVALGEDGSLIGRPPVLRDLPYRRLVGSPFDLSRRPVMPAVSTLTVRAGADGAEFLLHRRDPRAVAAAGGMLQVIPSGIFQPSSIRPAARAADFSLWRNIQREFSEELLGMAECDGDGQPVDYGSEPFATLDRARADGRVRVYALGVALDALTLVGEILTVLVVEADVFDQLAADFVDRNDEGSVVAARVPFTGPAIRDLLDSGRVAPAGAGCIELAWRWREHLLGV